MFNLSEIYTNVYNKSPFFLKNIFGSVYSYWSNKYKYGKVFDEWRKFLSESQYYTNEKLSEYQSEQIRELLEFTNEKCPYYRKLYKENCVNIRSEDVYSELQKIPVNTKDTIRANYKGIRTDIKTSEKLTYSSSGTTGTSIHIPTTEESLEREYAFKWQFQSVAGVKFKDRFAYFTGHYVIPVTNTKPPFYIRNYHENSIYFSIYHLSEKNIESYVDAFNKFSPEYITGYPSAFYTFSMLAKEKGLKVKPLKAIFSASEVLHDYQKEYVEKFLDTKIYKWYGQVELTINIHECEKRRMHVKEEYGYLELIKDDGSYASAGEYGNVIGTGFGNRAFPLVRYNTGDVMKLSVEQVCECGKGGRIIDEILGRDEDVIITPSGKYIGRLDFIFKPVNTVRESQIVQEDLQNVIIYVVTMEGFSKNDEEVILRKAKERLGDEMNIKIEKIKSIPRSKSGKIRYVISKVNKVDLIK